MLDSDIRRVLDSLLRERYSGEPDTLVRHEMGICAGKRRVDVVTLGSEICSYEIKSDGDTLSRLPGQADAYRQVFDRVTLVTTLRHLEKAIGLLPSWWGLMVAAHDGGRCAFLETVRVPGLNTGLDPLALAQMLWRDEAMNELKRRGLSRGLSKKARFYVWRALAEAATVDELRGLVLERAKARPEWVGAGETGSG